MRRSYSLLQAAAAVLLLMSCAEIIVKACDHPKKFFGGYFYPDKAEYHYNDKVYYRCPGYGGRYIYSICAASGRWKQASKCYDYCEMPHLDYGYYEPKKERYYAGDKVKYHCNKKYDMHYYGEKYDMATCGEDGDWSNKKPMCKERISRKCMAPDYRMYHHQPYRYSSYGHGDVIYYHCERNYYAPKKYDYHVATCTNGKWSKMPYKCEKPCHAGDHSAYHHMPYSKEQYEYGEKMMYICMGGYHKPMGYNYDGAMCGSDGMWDKKPFKCMKHCKTPEIMHGSYMPRKNYYKVGDKVNYACKNGYQIFYGEDWFEYNMCKDNGEWRYMEPSCKMTAAYCKAPYIAHGSYEPMKKMYSEGDRIHYRCKEGYKLFYDKDWYEYATCKKDGMLDFDPPKCRPKSMKYCMPEKFMHGDQLPMMKMYMSGDRMYYKCHNGYRLFYDVDWYEYRTCGEDGNWDFKPAMCRNVHSDGNKMHCMEHHMPHGYASPKKAMYNHNEKVSYSCNDGYEKYYEGDRYEHNKCMADGMWMHPAPMCKSKYQNYCHAPHMMHGSYYPKMKMYNAGDRMRYKCDHGYEMHYHSDERYEYCTCGKDGYWDKPVPMCKSVKMHYCMVDKLEHGMYEPMKKMYNSGDHLRYKCKEGYKLFFDKDWFEYNTCKDDGMWKFMHAKCKIAQKAYCDPPHFEHGMLSPKKSFYAYGDMISYMCKHGYELHHHDMWFEKSSCKSGGYWYPKPPMCKEMSKKYCYPPDYSHGDYYPKMRMYEHGERMYYRCDRGYKKMYHDGEYEYNTCMDGNWKRMSPKCVDMKMKYCKMPAIMHGSYMPMKRMYDYKDRVWYKCHDGYYMEQDGDHFEYSTCMENGMWDRKPPMCKMHNKKYCMPKHVMHGDYYPKKPQYNGGDKLYYFCKSGHNMKYENNWYSFLTCGSNGKWDNHPPMCMDKMKKLCPKPDVMHSSYMPMKSTYKEGDRLYFQCDYGYYKYYDGYYRDYSKCMDNGKWDRLPECRKMAKMYCKAPDYMMYHHKSYAKKNYMAGEWIKFDCAHGYYASPSMIYYATCKPNGKWSNDPYKCLKYCMGEEIKHGNYSPMKKYYKHGERISYKCMTYYNMRYHNRRFSYMTCQSDGMWDNKAPMCARY